ncbi:DNA polymerase III subunit alpha [Mycoplasmopsis meleagridis]|uniref:DNA polymerase III subunit alpha n=1 Tax=Mycoplasmopsis meleagridis TaxID=29561 RepID=UPI00073D3C82|nr:DNA polymerase III subunit alpha [Mycoplasmopsis meleagridis]KUH47369.1 DNA polymerase III subunit alpha [Mycoplasmopsis meleagridis]
MKIFQLHNNSVYSFLESLIKIEDLVKLHKENNFDKVVLTDHNNMFGLGTFLEECKKNDIKPIIGLDLDVENYRFILLAKNYEGYKFLNKLVLLKSQNKQINVIDINNENVFILDHPDEGYYAKTKKNIFSSWNNYYVHSTDKNLPNSIYLKANNALNKNDNDALKLLSKMSNKEIKLVDKNYFIDEEIDPIFIERISFIKDNCNVIFPEKKLNLAFFNDLNNEEAFDFFLDLIKENLLVKIKELDKYPSWKERLNYEIQVIKESNFVNYFLIIHDLIKWSKNNSIAIGPGRGSAAGSLVSYLLNITEINPLKYDLLFERFLNPKRLTWPDIDIDIQDDRRFEVFKYLYDKYGFENIALISTFQTIGAKMALKDVNRVMENNLNNIEINNLTKLLASGETLEEAKLNNRKFRIAIEKHTLLYELALKIEGLPRQHSFHPAGILITNDKVNEIVPTSLSNFENFQQVQLTMNNIENFGLLKIDLLGLKTLTELKGIEQFLEKEEYFESKLEKGIDVLNDKMTFDMLNAGITEGIFQLESSGMINTIKKVIIDKFDDLYAIISLFRPASSMYISDYAHNKRYKNSVKTIHPSYDSIVENTNGILIYQEQIMQIAQNVAKMSFSEADFLRRAISKKNDEEINNYETKFTELAIKNGLRTSQIKEIYEMIKRFGSYGFNKSHAVSYAYLTMKMAYYKRHYPLFYFSSLITNSEGSQEKVKKYVDEAKMIGFNIYSPDIIYSTNKCFFNNKLELYLPLNLIKGLGNENINKIITEKNNGENFEGKNITEIMLRLRYAGVKDNVFEILIKANCFRAFGPIKYVEFCNKKIKEIYDLFNSYNTFNEAKEAINQAGYLNVIFANPKSKEFEDFEYEKRNEYEMLGSIYNVYSTLKYEKNYPNRLTNLIPDDIARWYVCEIVNLKLFKLKHFCILEVRDSTKTIAFTFSENYYERFANLKIGQVILIQAIHKFNSKNPRIINWKEIE